METEADALPVASLLLRSGGHWNPGVRSCFVWGHRVFVGSGQVGVQVPGARDPFPQHSGGRPRLCPSSSCRGQQEILALDPRDHPGSAHSSGEAGPLLSSCLLPASSPPQASAPTPCLPNLGLSLLPLVSIPSQTPPPLCQLRPLPGWTLLGQEPTARRR